MVNNRRLQKPTETIMLPPATELLTVPGGRNELSKRGEFQPPLEKEVIGGIVQIDPQTDELLINNDWTNNQADACNDIDIPIALSIAQGCIDTSQRTLEMTLKQTLFGVRRCYDAFRPLVVHISDYIGCCTCTCT